MCKPDPFQGPINCSVTVENTLENDNFLDWRCAKLKALPFPKFIRQNLPWSGDGVPTSYGEMRAKHSGLARKAQRF